MRPKARTLSLLAASAVGGITSLAISTAPAAAQEMLTLHNTRRAQHCAPAMRWSAALAASAQTWANRCQFVHSSSAERPGQGENLAWGTGSFATAVSSFGRWYDEVSRYNFSAPGFSSATGHFTQIVWRGSTELGCAMAMCSGQAFWVCRYGPAGNITNPGMFASNVLPTSCRTATPPPPPGNPTPGPGPTPTPGGSGEWSAFATDGRGRWGYATHRANAALASSGAISGCGGAGAGCRVFWTTRDRCVSYAESRSGGFWYAAGGGPTDAVARQNAIRFCQSGTAPRGSCRTTGAWCRR
ncbi:MAG TPA: CAP domain-containing protein [Hyphomicrobiaceae bacterium]|nr:CAP domain-containing protein [Hyphomicrobiaceae bacterium]